MDQRHISSTYFQPNKPMKIEEENVTVTVEDKCLDGVDKLVGVL